MKGNTCTPVEQFCLVPADAKPRKLAMCYHCGMPVCSKCSWKRKEGRLCSTCLQENETNGRLTFLKRMYRLAGYKNYSALAKEHIEARFS